jgi:NAD-dependent deacetylase
VARLVATGTVVLVVTQNIDGLHQAAGTDPSLIVEIHGTMHEVECMSCGERGPMSSTLDRVRAGEEDPDCLACGGILKSATISFGQNLVAADMRRAEQAASQCDLLVAVGSSLAVFPAAGLVPTAHRAGAGIVIVNAEPTGFDDLADVVVRLPIGEALPAIMG